MIFNPEFSVTLDSPHLSPPSKAQPSSTYHPEIQSGQREDRNKREGEGIHPVFRKRMLSRITLVAHLFLDLVLFLETCTLLDWKISQCPHLYRWEKLLRREWRAQNYWQLTAKVCLEAENKSYPRENMGGAGRRMHISPSKPVALLQRVVWG